MHLKKQTPAKKNAMTVFFTLLIGFFLSHNLLAQEKLWQDVAEKAITRKGKQYIKPNKFRLLRLSRETLKQNLNNIPQGTIFQAKNSPAIIQLPMPDGSLQHFNLIESPLLSPKLAQKFPEIKTYTGQGIEDPAASLYLDFTPQGFHAMVLSPSGTVFIDPYTQNDTEHYIVYYKKDYSPQAKQQAKGNTLTNSHICQLNLDENKKTKRETAKPKTAFGKKTANKSGTQLRKYRLAVAATGEYTAFHGGTVTGAMSAITTTVNRVRGIYEKEVAITFELVSNNNLLIYTNAQTDPFSNDDAGALIDESQDEIDDKIGEINYDIGHTVSTGAGGLAGLGVVCLDSEKARGVTGSESPVGDPFDVDFVAHEIGHQFGANHTFNGNAGSCSGGNRAGSSAYEPGSGTTIMAYAGICGSQNIQNLGDTYFHSKSIEAIIDYSVNDTGDDCPITTLTGNIAPTVDAGTGGFTIPINTPFTLTGTASDANGDALTYCWEQFDLGPVGAPNSPSGNAPLFRSFTPGSSPSRTFPRLSDLLNNTQTLGEILPSYTRTLNFRLTVRDNRAGGGGINYDNVTFNVSNLAGPFLLTAPNTSASWQAGTVQKITWDVAKTNQAPVNCQSINILLSTDGGNTFPIVLASNSPNDGEQNIIVPNNASTSARIKIAAVGNIFFDISNANFTIQAATQAHFTLLVDPENSTVCAPNDAVYSVTVGSLLGFNNPVNLSITGVPTGAGFAFGTNPINPNNTTNLTISNLASASPGTYNLQVIASSTSGMKSFNLVLTIGTGGASAPVLSNPLNNITGVSQKPTFSWETVNGAVSYQIQIASDNTFTSLIETANDLVSNSYTLVSSLNSNTTYFWRVRAKNACGFGNYSAVFTFTTAAVSCTTFTSTDVPKDISSTGTPTITSTLNITGNSPISDLNVKNLVGAHSFINDLGISLKSPKGTTVTLFDAICDDEDNFNINFDDEAASANIPCPPTDAGTYKPQSPLSTFKSENPNGTWTLTIKDNAEEDGGKLDGWKLEICSANTTGNNPPTAANSSKTIDEDIEYTFLNTDFSTNYSDAEGDAFTQIRISNLSIPAGATLQLNNLAVGNNQVILQSDISTGKLKFKPVLNANGNNYASFAFSVHDGIAFSTNAYTFTINVTAINDAPIIEINEGLITFPKAETYLIDNTLLKASDPEGATASQITFTIKTKANKGNLLLNNMALDNNATFTQDDINNNRVLYKPNNATGITEDTFIFTLKDNLNAESVTRVFVISIDLANPLEDNILQAGTVVYPNPSEAIFKVKIEAAIQGKIRFTLTDIAGKVLQVFETEKNADKLQQDILLENNADGVYLLKIESNKGSIVKRLMKK